MSDFILKYKFTDRGGSKVFNVIQAATEYIPEQCLGQVRIPDDPRIKELESEIKEWKTALDILVRNDCQHTEVTVKPTGETWCDQCGELVSEVTVTTGKGIEYITAQETGE
jgi:hypothetical protein